MKLRDLATVKTNFPDADFWLRRSGDTKTVGEVLREFNPDAIGVKIERTDILDPTYARYMFQYLQQKGTWAQLASGVTVQHIRASDVANIQLSSQVTENTKKIEPLDKKKRIQDFIRWIYRKENITDPLPEIKFTDKKEAPDQHRTGYYDWHTNTMWVYTGHRNFVDVLRTLAHELIHRKQKQQKRIRQKSPPGSKLEREADGEAGMLMKLYARKHPEIIQELENSFEKAIAQVSKPKKDPELAALEEMLGEVKIDNDQGAGAVPWNRNVDYLGLRVQMRPSVFLRLALPLDNDKNDQKTIRYLSQIKDTQGFGAPFLEILVPEDWTDGNFRQPAKVVGHDGRHRMRAILDNEGDAPVEVHMIPRRGWRARDFTPEMIQELQSGMTAEWDRYLQGPLFDILTNEDLMMIPTAEQSIREATAGTLLIGGQLKVAVDDHALGRAATRNISPLQIDKVLKKLPSIADQIFDFGANQKVWIYDSKLDIALGLTVKSDRVILVTVLDQRPWDSNRPVIVIEGAGVPSLENKQLLEYDREKTAENYGAKLVKAARAKEFTLIRTESDDEDILYWALENLEQADPTPNKKYLQWIARNYIKSNTKMEDVVSTVHEQLVKFDTLLRRKKLPAGYTDINKYSSFGNFFDVMDTFENPEEELTNRGQARTVYNDDEARIIVPEDQAAACYYGQGTRWCTAATRGTNYFNHYNRQGPLYILLPKTAHRTGEKYQLHFATDQFMDENDDPVNLLQLMANFPGAERYFLANVPDMRDYVVYADDRVLNDVLNEIHTRVMDYLWDTVDDYRANNEWYWQQLRDEGYINDEGDVDWERAPDYLEYDSELKDLVNSVDQVLTQGAEAIRKEAAESLTQEGDQWTVDEIENLLADELQRMFYGEDAGVVSFLRQRISVRRDPKTNQYSVNLVPWRQGMRESHDDDLFEPSQRIKIGKFLKQYAWGMKENPDYWSAFDPEDVEEYEADIDDILQQAKDLGRVAEVFLTSTMQAGIEAFRQGDYNNGGWWFDRIADELEEATGIDIGTIADNLNEVSSIHQNVKKKLAKQGYGYIGSGVDQAAFSEPGSQENVLKIFGSRKGNKGWNFTPDQLMFVEWVKYCAAHADNPFLVRTLGYESFQHQQQPYLQIRQERLQPIDNITWGIVDDMVENISVGYTFQDWKEEWQDDRILSQFAKRIGGVDQLKLLYQTLVDVRKYGLSRGYRPDFHRDNIMMRGPGTPVIMDPWNIPMRETTEDYDPNGPPPGPESKPTMPRGTVRVDVSDVYDWYKLGQHISNLKGLGQHDFGKGPPSTIISFGDEDTEHRYIKDLEKTGLTTTDIDPMDPRQPKGMKRQKTDPTFNVDENFADGKKPGRKGLAKRVGVNCKQPVSKLRSIAKNSSGERQRMAHWCANMKSGRNKNESVELRLNELWQAYKKSK